MDCRRQRVRVGKEVELPRHGRNGRDCRQRLRFRRGQFIDDRHRRAGGGLRRKVSFPCLKRRKSGVENQDRAVRFDAHALRRVVPLRAGRDRFVVAAQRFPQRLRGLRWPCRFRRRDPQAGVIRRRFYNDNVRLRPVQFQHPRPARHQHVAVHGRLHGVLRPQQAVERFCWRDRATAHGTVGLKRCSGVACLQLRIERHVIRLSAAYANEPTVDILVIQFKCVCCVCDSCTEIRGRR